MNLLTLLVAIGLVIVLVVMLYTQEGLPYTTQLLLVAVLLAVITVVRIRTVKTWGKD